MHDVFWGERVDYKKEKLTIGYVNSAFIQH